MDMITNDLVATEFQLKSDYYDLTHPSPKVTFHRMVSPFYKNERWAVRYLDGCLNVSGEFEYEPLPSSRDGAFYKRCRFISLEEALNTYQERKEEEGE